MDALGNQIADSFGLGPRPSSTEIVVWDGFDQFEKEGAVKFFEGKSWHDVLAHLRNLKNAPVFGGAYFLEDWTVLSPTALPYYLRAYLEYLEETLSSLQPDEEFVVQLLAEMYQLIYMHKGSPFTSSQTVLLKNVACLTAERAEALGLSVCDDIARLLTQFLGELVRHDS